MTGRRPALARRDLAVAAAPLGLGAAVAACARWPALFRALVAEDGVLEWLQVAGFAAAAVGAVVLARRLRAAAGQGAATALLVATGFAFVVGEELAWGQRHLAVRAEAIQRVNDQGDLTLHNVGPGLRLSQAATVVLALGGAAVTLAPRRRRRGRRSPRRGWPAPPLWLLGWFASAAGYAGWRLLTPAPGFTAAKLSEVAELALAAGAAVVVWRLAGAAGRGQATGARDVPLA